MIDTFDNLTTGPLRAIRDSLANVITGGLSAHKVDRPTTTIIVPAYNEEEGLPHVLGDVLEAIDDTYEVIVVDDGSSDNTRGAAGEFPVRLISHEVNKGKGAAMQTGIRHARGEKVIFIDADGTYPASAIPEVARQLSYHDMVRCERQEGRGNIPVLNRLGNEAFDRIIKSMHRVEGGDVLSGLYGLKKSVLTAMRLDADGFDIELEIMIKAQAMNIKSSSVPISYNPRYGVKKLNPVRDGAKILARVFCLAVMYNPVAMYVVPGIVVAGLASLGLLGLIAGPIITPIANFSTNTLIVTAMAYLVGFQMVIFGSVVNLYAAQTGIGTPNQRLATLVARFPRLVGGIAGFGMALSGLVWSLWQALAWVFGGFGEFHNTEALVISLSLLVWGVQVLSTVLFLTLFATSARRALDK